MDNDVVQRPSPGGPSTKKGATTPMKGIINGSGDAHGLLVDPSPTPTPPASQEPLSSSKTGLTASKGSNSSISRSTTPGDRQDPNYVFYRYSVGEIDNTACETVALVKLPTYSGKGALKRTKGGTNASRISVYFLDQPYSPFEHPILVRKRYHDDKEFNAETSVLKLLQKKIVDTGMCHHLPTIYPVEKLEAVEYDASKFVVWMPWRGIPLAEAVSRGLINNWFDMVSLYIQLAWTLLTVAERVNIVLSEMSARDLVIEEAPFDGYFVMNYVVGKTSKQAQTKKHTSTLKTRFRVTVLDFRWSYRASVHLPLEDAVSGTLRTSFFKGASTSRSGSNANLDVSDDPSTSNISPSSILAALWREVCDVCNASNMPPVPLRHLRVPAEDAVPVPLKDLCSFFGGFGAEAWFAMTCAFAQVTTALGTSPLDEPMTGQKFSITLQSLSLHDMTQSMASLRNYTQRQYLQWTNPPKDKAVLARRVGTFHKKALSDHSASMDIDPPLDTLGMTDTASKSKKTANGVKEAKEAEPIPAVKSPKGKAKKSAAPQKEKASPATKNAPPAPVTPPPPPGPFKRKTRTTMEAAFFAEVSPEVRYLFEAGPIRNPGAPLTLAALSPGVPSPAPSEVSHAPAQDSVGRPAEEPAEVSVEIKAPTLSKTRSKAKVPSKKNKMDVDEQVDTTSQGGDVKSTSSPTPVAADLPAPSPSPKPKSGKSKTNSAKKTASAMEEDVQSEEKVEEEKITPEQSKPLVFKLPYSAFEEEKERSSNGMEVDDDLADVDFSDVAEVKKRVLKLPVLPLSRKPIASTVFYLSDSTVVEHRPSKLPVPMAGLGVFAKKKIKKGSVLTSYHGISIYREEDPVRGALAHTHLASLTKGAASQICDGTRFPETGCGIASLVNSNRGMNLKYNCTLEIYALDKAKLKLARRIVACADIAAGEELLADYEPL